jgi:ribonuclease BN (tRNA processing enzyme)
VDLTFYGVRGSFPSPGQDFVRYGGNTSSAILRHEGRLLFLDAGTGIVRAGEIEAGPTERIDILLTHLHMDHVQGLGFFGPLFHPGREVHIWGPPSTTHSLRKRLGRYLSPPLFPVRFNELPAKVICHDASWDRWEIGPFAVNAQLITHPGPTLGFRIEAAGKVVAFLPDHEPQLGCPNGLPNGRWLSGAALAQNADVLIHDSQYTHAEYQIRVGWGHCTPELAVDYARKVGAKRLVLDSHEPCRSDDDLDALVARLNTPELPVQAAAEGRVYTI